MARSASGPGSSASPGACRTRSRPPPCWRRRGSFGRGTGTTVHYSDGEPLITDGPFAETKEQLSGFWIIDVENLDEALAWAKKIPFTSNHVEIRPMVTGGKELLEKAERS